MPLDPDQPFADWMRNQGCIGPQYPPSRISHPAPGKAHRMTTAGWYHLSVKRIGRSTGRSVVAAAAYRLGSRLEEQTAQVVHDYRRRSGVETAFTMAPADAPAWAHDPERLWNAADQAEKRSNSLLAREVELALPAAVPPEVRVAVTEAFANELVSRYGVAVSVAIHLPDRDGDQRNHHAHILFTTRVMGEDGLGAKTRVLDDRVTGPEEIAYLRGYAAELINGALADSGSDERVDHRSFEARGIDQEPTEHLGPFATELERAGEPSEIGNRNREISGDNERRASVEELTVERATLDEQIATLEQEEDRFQAVHHGTVELSQPELVESATGPAEISSQADFDTVHQETMADASAERTTMAEDRRSRWSSALERVNAWWHNMREHFVEWRDHLQQRVDGYFGEPEPAQAASPAPPPSDSGPGDPNAMEPQL